MKVLWRCLEREDLPSDLKILPRLEPYVQRLEEIARQQRASKDELMDLTGPRVETRQIGEVIYGQHGVSGMVYVYHRIRHRLGSRMGSQLEQAWNGIGGWLA